MEDFFIAKINDREKIGKTRNSYITTLDYADKSLLVLSCASRDVTLFSFITVTGTIVGIVSASIRPVFLTSNGIVKMFLNTMGKINKHRKIALIARGKSKSIEKMISKALIDFGSSHEEFFLD